MFQVVNDSYKQTKNGIYSSESKKSSEVIMNQWRQDIDGKFSEQSWIDA